LKAEKKTAREQQKLLEYLARNGVDTSTVDVTDFEPTKERYSEAHLQGEATLAFAKDRTRFMERTCRTCKNLFATDYPYISTCSEKCMRKAVEEIGLTYRPGAKTIFEKWGRVPPRVVPPGALAALDEIAREKEVLQQMDDVHTDPIPSLPEPKFLEDNADAFSLF
jgi:hypothetical protein